MKNDIIDEAEFVCATPIKVLKGNKIIIGESTIVKAEKNLIVLKKNKKGGQ